MSESTTIFQLPDTSRKLFENMLTVELLYLINLFIENNFEIKVAGGAVRDIIMCIIPHDFDFVSNATTTEMKQLFTKHNIRMINSNGESHGTIVARINDKENFEITTLRIDKKTDGRRAEVCFTNDWKVDAGRRDLTINSMFLDINGVVYDYCGGKEDIETRTIRFVENPSLRIQEDHLRILRYFRFYGIIAKNPNEHLQESLDAIRENSAGLKQVSGERIWTELRKILTGNFAPEIMEQMKCCGILPYLGLPENSDLSTLKSRFAILKHNNCHPTIILSTIFNNKSEITVALKRLKFSKDDLIYLLFMINNRDKMADLVDEKSKDDRILKHCKDTFVMNMGDPPQTKLRLCFIEYFKYINRLDLMKEYDEWKAPTFPIRGDDLSKELQVEGKMLGEALNFLKRKWMDSNYGAIVLDDELKDELEKLGYSSLKQKSSIEDDKLKDELMKFGCSSPK